ncbi:MAG: CHAD domain-containing protein [Actinomycetota bacterium]|nr:CHAD domain-containing protein [Actinomycetota bacterium]
MSYRLEHPGELEAEIRRVAIERLEHALEELSAGLQRDPAEAVHAARKDLKKTRSLLRFARDSLSKKRYRAENQRLREAAHLLAGAREADAQVESLQAMIEYAGARMSPECLAAADAWLTSMRSQKSAQSDRGEAASQAALLIAASRDEARLWALGRGGFELIAPGLHRTYRQGRRFMSRAMGDPSDETVHEWRKRVKDLWYSLRLLEDVWPESIGATASEAHALSELLGDHHDLGEVRIAAEAGAPELSPEAQVELLKWVRIRQDELHRAAMALGRRLYAERPRRYAQRLEGLWQAWEADAAQQAGQFGLPSS